MHVSWRTSEGPQCRFKTLVDAHSGCISGDTRHWLMDDPGAKKSTPGERSGRGGEHRFVKRGLHAGADGHAGRKCQQQTAAERCDQRCRDACDERDPQHNFARRRDYSQCRHHRGGQQWIQGSGVSKQVRKVAPRDQWKELMHGCMRAPQMSCRRIAWITASSRLCVPSFWLMWCR